MALQRFPGFIDIHVHLRDPGATHKEDFVSGSRAAIKGGFTFVCDMPNNPSRPTVTITCLQEKIDASQKKAICDVGFHYGTNGNNLDSFPFAFGNPHVFGLKIYCNHTTGGLLVEDEKHLDSIFASWESTKPILVHAEGELLMNVLALAKTYGRRLHVCHVSQAAEIALIRHAKIDTQPVTAGVTPHHLFLTEKDREKLRAFVSVKPEIRGAKDRGALWAGLEDGTIDIVESDHAPHTKEEKKSETPPFGVPGLETTVGLLMKAAREKKWLRSYFVPLLYENPKKIFNIPDQGKTYIELNPDKPYIMGEDGYETKCGWSPFDGWELYGKVQTVILRGKELL